MAGRWQQHELWDGTYNINDLWDCLEIIAVQNENEERAQEAAEQEVRQ
ncbi:DUF6889 family protein [Anaerotruncus rubiinfantis]